MVHEFQEPTVFEDLREAFRDLLGGKVALEDRRSLLHAMKESLVHVRVARDELLDAIEKTRRRLRAEQNEFDTTRRRKGLAEGIGDQETAKIATRFEGQQGERLAITQRKLENQEAELALLERELEEMTQQLKAAGAGVGSGIPPGGQGSVAGAVPDPLADETAGLDRELDTLGRAQRRAAQEADADARLAELKRRMGGGA